MKINCRNADRYWLDNQGGQELSGGQVQDAEAVQEMPRSFALAQGGGAACPL